MRARLLSIEVPEAFDGDLRSIVPEDPEMASVVVNACIGSDDASVSGECFTFRVCTPAWLAAAQRVRGFEFVQHTLLVERWDPELVEQAIADLCEGCEERDWTALTRSLSRFGRWEFEAWYPALGGAAV